MPRSMEMAVRRLAIVLYRINLVFVCLDFAGFVECVIANRFGMACWNA